MPNQRSVTDARVIRLRYKAVCSVCGVELSPGTEAIWDREAKTATCIGCAESVETGADEPSVAEPTPLDRGQAGASARRRYEHLHEKREKRIRGSYGRLGGIYLALTDDPQSTRAWGVGGSGEWKLGGFLESLNDDETIIALHDRRIPGSRANIDHIAVARSGVYVVDAKNYKGQVRKADKGGLFSVDLRLFVGRRDCTRLIAGMKKQVEAIREAFGQPLLDEFELAITPVLCFVDAEWSLFARPFQLGGVWVEWPKSLSARLRQEGPLQADHVRFLAERLVSALPAA
ncbi:MAG: nuclease-related domain-containing protein [Gaiellaceae bacterium]